MSEHLSPEQLRHRVWLELCDLRARLNHLLFLWLDGDDDLVLSHGGLRLKERLADSRVPPTDSDFDR